MSIEDSAKRKIMQSLSSRSCKHKLKHTTIQNSRTYRAFARGGTESIVFVVVQLLTKKYADCASRHPQKTVQKYNNAKPVEPFV